MSASKPSNLRPKGMETHSHHHHPTGGTTRGGKIEKSSTSSAGGGGKSHGKYVATACESCKKAKRKCDGNSPCQTCVDKGTPCIFDESKDGRRGRKRTLDELYAKVEAFDTLLDSIRATSSHDDSDHAIANLLNLIRSEASVDDIVRHARSIIALHHDDSNPNSSMKRRSEESSERARNAVMSIAALVDEPPIHVPARPWTTVSHDDDFVSHLISIYFTWHHESYPCVDRDLFVASMNAGDVGSQYCSPFLVNCMLLTACLYSDHPMVYAVDHDNATRGLHFADEVARLWSIEEGRATLANLQGLVALSLGLGVLRKDRLAMIYARQMPSICVELGRKVKRSLRAGEPNYASPEYQRSLQLARWSAYQMEVDFCMIWVKSLELSQPTLEKPYTIEQLHVTEVWHPYPKGGPDVKFNPYGLHDAKLELRKVGADIVPVLLSGNPDDSPVPDRINLDRQARMARLEELMSRLRTWHESLSPYAQCDTTSTVTPAWSLVELHLVYHDYSIAVQSLMIQDLVSAGFKRQAAKLGLLRACEEVASLFDWVQRTLGNSVWCAWGFQAAARAAYTLLDVLTEVGVPDTFDTIISCISVVAKRWVLARGVIKMLWITLQQRQLVEQLNISTLELFNVNAVEQWGPDDYRLFEKCMYPNYAAIDEKGRELADMGELLEQWSKLAVN